MSERSALPSGWVSTTLGTVRVDRSTGVNPAEHKAETFELYSIPAHPSGRPEVVTGSEIGSTKQLLEPRAVIVSKINPRINRVWVVGDRSAYRQIGSSEWIPFFPIDGVSPKYLAYYMRKDVFRNHLAANVSGVGGSLMRVKPSTLDPFPFAMAPQPEQPRIVEAIESYLTRLDDAQVSLERAQINLKRYRASVLKAAVEGRLVPTEAELAKAEHRSYEPASALVGRIRAERQEMPQRPTPIAPSESSPTLPDGWCWTTVGQCVETQVGFAFKSQDFRNEGARLLRGDNIGHGRLRWDDGRGRCIDLSALQMYPQLQMCADDLVLAMDRPLISTGLKFARVRGQDLPALLVQRVLRLRPHISREYFEWILLTDLFSSHLGSEARGGGVPHVSQQQVERFVFPLPPLAEQLRIAREAARLLSGADESCDAARANSLRCSRLQQAVLRWAFEGRLVDQNSTDEPASVLLDRIRVERDAASAAAPKARRARRAKAST